jgi:carbonic anhydrase
MKKSTYLIVFTISLIVFTSCEKNSDSDGGRIRISKIADNPEMENAKIYEYNSSGLLSKVTEGSDFVNIEYNSSGLPIKINRYDFEISLTTDTYLEWTENSFIVTGENLSYNKIEYIFNTNNQIVKAIYFVKNEHQIIDTSMVTNYFWSGADSLKISNIDYSDMFPNSVEYYKFGNVKSPFKGFNIAFFVFGHLLTSLDLEEIQNSFATAMFDGRDYHETFTYVVNEQNFPTKANITFTGSEGTDNFSTYLEYESY